MAIRDDTVPTALAGFRDQLQTLAERLDNETDLGQARSIGFLPDTTGPDAVLARCLTPMAMHYLMNLKDLAADDEELLDRIGSELNDLARGGVFWHCQQVTVAGVRPEAEFTHKDIRIRSLSSQERGALWEQDMYGIQQRRSTLEYVPPATYQPLDADTLLEIRTSRPRSKDQDESNLARPIVLAFFLSGFDLRIHGGVVAFNLPQWSSIGFQTTQPFTSNRQFITAKPIDRSTFEKIIDLGYQIPDFTSNESDPHEIALDRLLRACGATNSASGFLDFVIALEAALLAGVETELSYRFSLYGALFLKPERDPTETFKKLREVYSVRSKIVHGSPVKPAKRTAAVNDAADIAKAVIRRAIEQSWPQPSELDKQAVSAWQPKVLGVKAAASTAKRRKAGTKKQAR